jgi:uncharacterized protein
VERVATRLRTLRGFVAQESLRGLRVFVARQRLRGFALRLPLRAPRASSRGVALLVVLFVATAAHAQPPTPELTQPVNDFANVVDAESERAMEMLIRSLQQATGDVVVVATVDTFAPYGDIREYAVKMFENHGRGVGQRGRDNGLLILVAVKDRQVRIEVGYDLEQFVTDGFAGETSRQFMAPEFRRGAYGAGLLTGSMRVIERIASGRNVTLPGVQPVARRRSAPITGSGGTLLFALFVFLIVIRAIAAQIGRGRRSRRWGGGPWSGWNSGVGPFGGGRGGFGGGFGGFGGGGGFGGFGGGRSGGGGGGAGW